MSDYADIRRDLSARRLQKYGPLDQVASIADWLVQLDDAAKDLGLPNVYRTHPSRMPVKPVLKPVERDR